MATRLRLRSVDALRGAVLAFMVLTPATGDPASYPFLRHAAWGGPTASDLVLPTFLVTSGLSLAFLLRASVDRSRVLRLVRRVLALVVLGLVYNAYGTTGWDLGALRFTGVLQLIGVAGALAAVVVLVTRRLGRDRPWAIGAIAVALPAAYGIGLRLLERFLLQTSTMAHAGDRTVREVLLDVLPGSETTVHLAFTAALLAVVAMVTSILHWRRAYLTL